MVEHLVSYFENLSTKMENQPLPNMTKRVTRKDVTASNRSSVQKIISDMTEVKRPPGKHKKVVNSSVTKRTQTRTAEKSIDCTTRRDKKTRHLQTSTERNTNDIESNQSDEITIGSLNKKCDEIQKKVDEFGENLKRKRRQLQQKNTANTTENIIGENSNFFIHNHGEEENNEESIQDIEEHSTENDNDSCRSSSRSINTIDSNGSIDDIFGSNDFDENQKDNYVLEAYNKAGQELVITYFQITKRTVPLNQQKAVGDAECFDYVFYSTESISDMSSISDNSSSSHVYQNQNFEEIPEMLENQDHSYYSEIVTYEKVDYNGYESDSNVRYSFGNNSKLLGDTNRNEEHAKNYEYINYANNYTSVQDGDYRNNDSFQKNKLTKKERINYIIEEMIKTEEQYISALKLVVKRYIPHINSKTPRDLLGKTSYLFGNIEPIFINAQDFYKALNTSSKDANTIAQTFIDAAPIFELYPLYSKNKPTADVYLKQFDDVVREREHELKDKLGLASHLLTPIQRLGKYVLLLEQIRKELAKQNKDVHKIEEAIKIVRKVMKKGNDYIAIDSINNSAIDLTMYGSFIIRAPFNIHKPRKFYSMVFLFDNIVVFTEKSIKNVEHFKYVDSIQMSELSLGKFEEKPTIFHLTNYTKSKRFSPDATYILEAESSKMKLEWTSIIEKKLWEQLETAKRKQKEMDVSSNRHKVKSASLPRPSNKSSVDVTVRRTRSKSKSTFYITDA